MRLPRRTRSRRVACALALVAGAAVALAAARSSAVRATPAPSGAPTTPAATGGTWHRVAAAPFSVGAGLNAVWTGRGLLVYGLTGLSPDGSALHAVERAALYDPSTNRWRELTAPPPPTRYPAAGRALWSGRELLVWGGRALDPARDRWRLLPSPPDGGGIVVWTGREMLGWGGGCCGDATAGGAAYDPATNAWRRLARSPLPPTQRPLGVFTGRELVVVVSGLDPDGRPYPARFALAAAYDPSTDTWRRLPPLPQHAARFGGTAVWDGHEVLVVATGARSRAAFALDPTARRWRRLATMPRGRIGATAVWTGRRLLLVGGRIPTSSEPVLPARALVYVPRRNRWSVLPPASMRRRDGAAAVWTGRTLFVVGGSVVTCGPDGVRGCRTTSLADVAAFTPGR
jgi:N-acetylneuraminic acid mutarotase